MGWFKLKYHPEDALKRKDECKGALEKRIDVFTRFLEEKRFNDIAIDGDQSDPMVKLLDSVVIFLEGGTDFDLEILDQELVEKEVKIKAEEEAESAKNGTATNDDDRAKKENDNE